MVGILGAMARRSWGLFLLNLNEAGMRGPYVQGSVMSVCGAVTVAELRVGWMVFLANSANLSQKTDLFF